MTYKWRKQQHLFDGYYWLKINGLTRMSHVVTDPLTGDQLVFFIGCEMEFPLNDEMFDNADWAGPIGLPKD